MAVRRIVTGHNAAGKSCFLSDGPTPGFFDAGYFQTNEIWTDDPANADPHGDRDPAASERFKLAPPVNGSTVRIFTFPPPQDLPAPTAEALANMNARWDAGDSMEIDDPGMHTTGTIDYGIVLSGEIFLELDEGEVHLTTGDVVVQRATRHAWRNRSTSPCTMAFILIGSPNYQN
jgi:mannose-6-phosphate isomerase-like protein (cupin superfamily)